MTSALDWLRKQSWTTRLIMSALFASISGVALYFDHIWLWGFAMAVLPLLGGRRSRDGEDFFREVRPTNEAPPLMVRCEMNVADLAPALERLSAATTSGFKAVQIAAIVEAAASLPEGHEQRFHYVVTFAKRPVSLQITIAKNNAGTLELRTLGDPKLVECLKEA
jgi:hypothetical protein